MSCRLQHQQPSCSLQEVHVAKLLFRWRQDLGSVVIGMSEECNTYLDGQVLPLPAGSEYGRQDAGVRRKHVRLQICSGRATPCLPEQRNANGTLQL